MVEGKSFVLLEALSTAIETFERIRDESDTGGSKPSDATSHGNFGDVSTAQGLKSLNAWLESRSYIAGWTPTQADESTFNALKKIPDESQYPHASRWYNHIASFGAAKSQFPGAKTPIHGGKQDARGPEPSQSEVNVKATVAPDDEEEIDLFGDDEEVDEEAERIKAERIREYEAKKAKKTKEAAKSSILLDVKPWDDETDMSALEANVRSIAMEGLVWGQSKLVAVGFGIKKLQISCVIEDDKVGVDDLSDRIQEDEDHVQSVDVGV
ncbi:hypothetical protein M427DRAFT_103066 [Gonapodya prolifera JEL478]|uniref:Elongation factor 1-beta n=1 Tax=Gonapodya prolifera (strain JEL478) TaxID=1344416 RepID=A0A139A303_GONPJ|nr:hypothetical protein M427DRAFT_103066 [Gonapodya prolifera JEL478]|eukprot:KXS10905.1 hypothetical protein M427DRAFT_103066 [Gonapodya prolifera JEL478]